MVNLIELLGNYYPYIINIALFVFAVYKIKKYNLSKEYNKALMGSKDVSVDNIINYVLYTTIRWASAFSLFSFHKTGVFDYVTFVIAYIFMFGVVLLLGIFIYKFNNFLNKRHYG